MTRIRVAVIGGGSNSEHDVSRASASAVKRALDPARYDVVALTIARDGSWHRSTGEPLGIGGAIELLRGCDVSIPMVHGRHGEDGTLAALCECAGVPYVGSGVSAGAIGMDKWMTKVVAESIGLGVAPGVLCNSASAAGYRFTHPVVVKPVAAGSSQGVSLATTAEQLRDAVDAALAEDDRILIEEVITGREVDIAVMRRADDSLFVSPPLEIAVDGVFDYASKYASEPAFIVPTAIDELTERMLRNAAIRMYEALDASGVMRVDCFVTDDGLVLNEVNTAPGFTERSQVPLMFQAAGVGYGELLDDLIAAALATASDRTGARPSAIM